jgi:hypothetical protein
MPKKPRKGHIFRTTRTLDLRSTGGPLIPKGTYGIIQRVHRTGELSVDLDVGDKRVLNRDDIVLAAGRPEG